MITAQLVCGKSCTQAQVTRVFGVSKSSVLRAMKTYRAEGPGGFYRGRRRRHGGTVLTAEVRGRAQEMLDQGRRREEVAAALGVKSDTLRKAMGDGRLRKVREGVLTKSARSAVDALAAEGLGTACTRTEDRTLAAFGVLEGAPTRFEACLDVSHGGALCALPALVLNGLLGRASGCLGAVGGYYRMGHILLLLAFMALCRIRTAEQVRGKAPGELGKLLGLDRVPEVRCLRRKLDELSADGAAETWAGHLSREWMQMEPRAVGTLYVDGHVRVYHGHQTELPRKYVSRERLCLRGVMDYWVNDAWGRPFFVVEQPVDPGLIEVLRSTIVPRLLGDVPCQPSEADLAADPYLCRFALVFDRQGYSPTFFVEMWHRHRIGCVTYHKYPREPWPEGWCEERRVSLANGETVGMELAERGSLIGSGHTRLWVREIRKRTESGHQTSLISTMYGADLVRVAAALFSRWCQENFFRYMREHYAIDTLGAYETADFPATQRVVNPAWRELERRRLSIRGKLMYRQARFAALTLHPEPEDEPRAFATWQREKTRLREEVEDYEHEMGELKTAVAATPKHIQWKDLPDAQKFQRLAPGRKQLLDTVRMIAYRAETAMAALLAPLAGGLSDARAFFRDLFTTEADILPEPSAGRLRVRAHARATPAFNRLAVTLLEDINQSESVYPGTDLVMCFELIGGAPPTGPPGVTSSSQR